MARKRNRTDIINDMLIAILDKGGEIKPTHLMYRANLSHGLMQSYLEEVIDKEMIRKIDKSNYTYLTITDKGCNFVEKFKEMKEFEKTFGL